jgi:type I restriction-modification system DNA methylase subunit
MEYKKLLAAVAEVPDKDGRIIPAHVLERAVEVYNERRMEESDRKLLYREGGDPNFIEDVAGVIQDVEYDEDTKQVFVDVDFLDNTNGQIAKDLLQAGLPMYASFSASGVFQNRKYGFLDFSHFYLSHMPPNGVKFVKDFSEE